MYVKVKNNENLAKTKYPNITKQHTTNTNNEHAPTSQ